ncbi:MAG TPA: MAPEG family protein [Caulobacteraceae bacterium]|jgi:uncharacterized membrane protein YecN with MAPEG domain|nr:MAPEG family protein [Caulobacteraceae bacterium]
MTPIASHMHALVALVTVVALLLYFWMGLRVGRARSQHGVAAPSMTGNADFERVVRVQANTLEWLPLFLVSLWLFAIYLGDLPAAAIGVIWIVGRMLYMVGYSRDASARSSGFLIQLAATALLMFGVLIKAVMLLASGGMTA